MFFDKLGTSGIVLLFLRKALLYKKKWKSIDFCVKFIKQGLVGVDSPFFIWIIFVHMDLNKVMIIGRATNNLQVKTIESSGTPVVNFTVATNRKFKNKDWNILEDAEYHRCVAYGKWADVLGKYLNKGKRIYIEGRLRTRKRQDSEWVERFSTEIIVDNFIFLDPKGGQEVWDELELHDAELPMVNPEDEDVPF